MSESKEILLKGNCQCLKTSYTSTSLPSAVANCYCSTCTSQSLPPSSPSSSPTPYVQFADFPQSSITWSPPLISKKYSEIAERMFCKECGDLLAMWYYCERERVSVRVSTVDEGSVRGVLPGLGREIFVPEEVMGKEVEGVERYKGFSQGFQKRLNAWREEEKGKKSG